MCVQTGKYKTSAMYEELGGESIDVIWKKNVLPKPCQTLGKIHSMVGFVGQITNKR